MPSDLAALRGEPSYVWREGQERQLRLIARWTNLPQARVLVDGIGIGMYAHHLQERYQAVVDGMDIEFERVQAARERAPRAIVAACEALPYPAHTFDVLLSHEVLEHVNDDRLSAQEMVRVMKVGGRIVIFCPNRWYFFETHGHFWRGKYHFGNTPLINYLPDPLRNRLAPHVRAYTKRGLLRLFAGEAVRVVHYQRIYAAYDNWIRRLGAPMRIVRDTLQRLENTPLDTWGMSHFLVLEKIAPPAER
jgi:SAM-dependent methyltransferase